MTDKLHKGDGPMRVLFTVPPGLGHSFPTVPLAWALRSAGHEVLVATAADGVDAAARAGLLAVDTAPGVDVNAIFGAGRAKGAGLAKELREGGEQIARAQGRTPDFVLQMFAKVSEMMAAETLRVARDWRPDLVVYSRFLGTGLLVANALGIPAIEHGMNLVREDDFAERYLPFLAATGAQHGVPERQPVVEAVHVAAPPFLVGEGGGWYMRYVPYNSGGALPDWLWQPAERPQVLVTMGTVMPMLGGLGSVAPLLAAAAEVDAEFLLAFGDSVDISALGTLPANARRIGWVPLTALLTRCAAVVHHGGAGTTLTALATGVPQLVLPHAGDQFVNAEVVATHGLGLRRAPGEVDVATLTELVGEDRFRTAARAAADQVREQPTPGELVPRLEALAARATAPAPA